MTTSTAVRLTAVRRRYRDVTALDGVDLRFEAGTFTAIMGPSGSGKSTLLQCAAGLDRPTSGSVEVGGVELTGLSERRLTLLRRDRIGFVFQAFNLLPSLTAAQNVALPLRLAGRRPSRTEIRDALERVGLGDRARHRPGELSGGQQQRVALARALVTRPAVLFGDEPTGALDTGSSREVLRLLRELTDRAGQTVVMVTHDPVAAAAADRVVFLVDGRVADEVVRPDAGEVARRMAGLEAAGGVGVRPSGGDGSLTVGGDSSLAVGRDGSLTVGRDSVRPAGRDGSPTAGGDGSLTVGRDSSLAVGRDSFRPAGRDGSPTAGRDGFRPAGRDGSPTAGRDSSPTAGRDSSLTVGRDDFRPAGRDDSPTAGRDSFRPAGRDGSPTAGRDSFRPAGVIRR